MEIKSPLFNDNDFLPKKYTCDGEDVSPPLVITNVPEEAQSLVLIVFDPDAAQDGFTHWILFNIDPRTEVIEENSVPEGAEVGLNDSGQNSYTGACPPSGTHRYFFSLYALDVPLSLFKVENVGKKEIEEVMADHIIEQADLIGLYART
jgi:Raf kinase inhibitor-like YbhB/YbcL family protein